MPGFAFLAFKRKEPVDDVEHADVVLEAIPMDDDVKVVISDDEVTKLIEVRPGMTKEEIATELKKPGVNGYPIIQSYVLGLDSKSATSKPVVATEQVADTGSVKISLAAVGCPLSSVPLRIFPASESSSGSEF